MGVMATPRSGKKVKESYRKLMVTLHR